MSTARSPFLIGLDLPTTVGAVADPVAAARTAEALGFDFVSSNDHLLGGPARYEGWTLLTHVAASTSRLRFATRVLGVPYRHPVLVAKMAETFDRLTGGRLILGLGAGSGETEFAAMGIEAGDARQRVRGLEEAIGIIRGLWTQTPFAYGGERYQVDGASLEPKPDHPIPIWLGAVGPRGLELVGRAADGWIPSPHYAPAHRVPGMVARIREAAGAAGRDAGALSLIYNVSVTLAGPGDDEVVGGSPVDVADRLVEFLEMGFTGFNLIIVGTDRAWQVERLGRDVLPVLRAAAESAGATAD
jgi:probable F420-dependent oxidoreductase